MKRLALIAASVVLAASANAATVSYNFANALAVTEITQTGTLGLFDSSLGTLTGATLTVNGDAVMSFTGTNTAAQANPASLTSQVTLFWNSSLGALNPFLTDTILLSSTTGLQLYAVGETKSFGPFTEAANNVDDLATIFGSLQASGGGNFNVSCDSLSGLTVLGGGGNISTTQQTRASCGASIVYSYDVPVPPNEVPEPSSLALVGLALAGIGYSGRRRKV